MRAIGAWLTAAGLLAGACSPAGVAVGTGATAGTAAAQERPIGRAISDAGIRAEINYLWATADLALYRKVELSIVEGRVLLTGAVRNPETRIEAARLAWQADGVREVINEIQLDDKSTLSDQTRDAWIAAKLRARLVLDSGVRSINYTLDVVNGTVYLLGLAQDQTELDRVIGHARDTAYVRNVVNHARLKADPKRGGS